MEEIQQQISLLHRGFLVCLGLSIVFLLVCLLLFFLFDIRNIFNIRTGRSVRKAVQEMETRNAGSRNVKRTVMREWRRECPETQDLCRETALLMESEMEREADQSYGTFHIEKYIMVTHTKEEL